jgi:hypothetical protein
MTEEICGTCRHHKHIYTHVEPCGDDIRMQDGWVCVNEYSENAGCYTEYRDTCDDWEEK